MLAVCFYFEISFPLLSVMDNPCLSDVTNIDLCVFICFLIYLPVFN